MAQDPSNSSNLEQLTLNGVKHEMRDFETARRILQIAQIVTNRAQHY